MQAAAQSAKPPPKVAEKPEVHTGLETYIIYICRTQNHTSRRVSASIIAE